ncbi:MAG: peroxiredoxin family protein [Hyphomonadaceae bacterium]
MKKLIAALVLATAPTASIAMPALAQVPAGMELGPKVGAKVPAFDVVDTNGASQTLTSISGDKGVTLVFFRSADWCPFCKGQLKNLNSVAAELEGLGWPVVGVSYDPEQILTDFSKANGLTYKLMTDPGSKAIDAFGIRNEGVNNSPRFNGIPHPIILFIAKDGTVKAKLYEEAYQKRPPADLVLSTAKGLN